MSTINDALNDAQRDLEVAAEASVESVADAATEAAEGFVTDSLADPEDVPLIPDLPTDGDARSAVNFMVDNAAKLFEAHAADAIASLAAVGVEAMEKTTKITTKMVYLAEMVAQGKLSPESAEYASAQYVEALRLVVVQGENRTKAIAYDKARASLLTAKSLLFTGLRLAVSVGTKAATGYLGGISLPTVPT